MEPDVARATLYATTLNVIVEEQFSKLCGDIYSGSIIEEKNNGLEIPLNVFLTGESSYSDTVGFWVFFDGPSGSVVDRNSPEAQSWPTQPILPQSQNGQIDLSREVNVDGFPLTGGTGPRTLIFTPPKTIQVKWP